MVQSATAGFAPRVCWHANAPALGDYPMSPGQPCTPGTWRPLCFLVWQELASFSVFLCPHPLSTCELFVLLTFVISFLTDFSFHGAICTVASGAWGEPLYYELSFGLSHRHHNRYRISRSSVRTDCSVLVPNIVSQVQFSGCQRIQLAKEVQGFTFFVYNGFKG